VAAKQLGQQQLVVVAAQQLPRASQLQQKRRRRKQTAMKTPMMLLKTQIGACDDAVVICNFCSYAPKLLLLIMEHELWFCMI
jgi:3-deoxy-D-manno-octulosonic-acid transferase